MAITYPRAFPALFVGAHRFTLQRTDLVAPETSGAAPGVTFGVPIWTAEYEAAGLTDAQAADWQAWMLSLRGSQGTFYASDLRRLAPRAYPSGVTGLTRAGGGAFDGTATSWSVNTPKDVLTLNGLPASYQATAGDYVGFQWGSGNVKRHAVRFVESATANGSGVLVAAIEPALPLAVSGSATARLDQHGVVMRMVPGASEDGASEPFGEWGAKIMAIQDLRP
jgi:hypothetical protein